MHAISISTTLIKQCKTLSQLTQIHSQLITTQTLNPFLLPTLLHSLTFLLPTLNPKPHHNNNLLRYSNSIFNTITTPTTFSYNNLIRLHTLLNSPHTSLHLFTQMRRLSIPPDSHTFPFLISASSLTKSLSLVYSLHCLVIKFGFLIDLYVLNGLIKVYSGIEEKGCTQGRRVLDAWKVFDESTVRDVVSCNAMIDGFVKSGDLERARWVFEGMWERDAVSWGGLMAGYVRVDMCADVIRLYERMLSEGCVRPDNVALVAFMSACGRLGEVEKGRGVHDYIVENRIRIDKYLCTGLVDLYAKCGDIEMAREIFESCSDRNLFTWNAMLVGLAMHGECQTVLTFFSRMVESGIQPDSVSFLAVLIACSHSGLVEEARLFFHEMDVVYNVPKEPKHYGCMADLLARAGLIMEATEMIDGMKEGGDNLLVWGGLLGGCRTHENVTTAEKVAKNITSLDPEDGGVYSIMLNVYTNAERWDEAEGLRRLMREKSVKRKFGRSVIHLSGYSK